ncbi:PEP/pyruvate-binding domain-containing protein [Kouleothrix sp.]|uniref:PEP/pyruvate-binding domain-containing protein n=1 Tax=Kouleothrix sp. TaxID=2779161 RepID=UPI00391A8AD5
MNTFVIALSDAAATLENVGGKGMSLAKLLSAQLPVPGGFHVTTAAYRQFVAANGLAPRIAQALAGLSPTDTAALDAASEQIRALFAAGATPPEIAEAVAGAYAALRDAAVAVRSSATAEDLPGASFAGQQETYLNIRGAGAVLAAVKQCWASLWTARAIAYRINNAIDQTAVALAVVVQELVFADAAGIMFTANPVNGKRDELVINAAWGRGEAVVSGAVTPDTLTVQKGSGRVLRRETAEKVLMTVRAEGGTREQPVPAAQRRQPVLGDAQAGELAQLGARIEQLYGTPMDIEWALAGGRFFIVQARPITALPPEWRPSVPDALYTRNSLAEHVPGPVTPLFATLGLEIANRVSYQFMERVAGRQMAAGLVPNQAEYEALNGYLYRRNHLKIGVTLRLMGRYIPQFMRLARESVALWQDARQQFGGVVAEWEQKPLAALRPSELLDGVRAIFTAAIRYYNEIQATLPIAAVSEALFTAVYDRLIRREGDPPASTFMLGLDTVSLRADKALFDLAGWLRANPALAGYVASSASARLEADLRQAEAPAGLPGGAWAEWRARFDRHLHQFGRTAYEFDFANPTPQEQPGPVLDAFKAFVAGAAGDPYQREREAAATREQATQAVMRRVGWPRRGWFAGLLRWAQATGPMREDSLFDMGMGHPLMRRMLAELGRRFAEGGAVAEPGAIYWLEKAEVIGLAEALERGIALPDLAGRIPARKAQWQAALRASPPVLLPENSRWARFMHGGPAKTQDGKLVLSGVGTSGGRVTAPACVLFGPDDFGKLRPGDVLVAVTTTPAWTPLFAQAAAVVTDIGGPLSHSSIVAREYGIPAVMAAGSATRAIHSGQLVTVDGTAGTVTVEG